MSVHYKHPLLLIEFEEHKSFSLEVSGVSPGKSIRQIPSPGPRNRSKILREGEREVSVQGSYQYLRIRSNSSGENRNADVSLPPITHHLVIISTRNGRDIQRPQVK